MYYTEPKTKLIFLENIVRELSFKNALIIDFDTQLTNLKKNTLVNSEYPILKRTNLILPYMLTFQTLIDEITNHCNLGSLIVVDSLNGLLDYFGINFYPNGNGKTKIKNDKNMTKMDNLYGNIKHAGYKGFSILNILFQNQFLKDTPIVITSYITKRGLDNLITELVMLDDSKSRNRNHFRRISNSVLSLDFITNDHMLICTVLKKETNRMKEPIEHLNFFPQSIKIKINIHANP